MQNRHIILFIQYRPVVFPPYGIVCIFDGEVFSPIACKSYIRTVASTPSVRNMHDIIILSILLMLLQPIFIY